MKKINKIDELIAAAVLWWTKYLSKPAIEGINGDNKSEGSILALYAKLISQKNEQITDEKIKKFMKLLTNHLEEKSKTFGETILGTDYGPEWPLSEICEKGGILGSCFPQKTTMWVNFKKETVMWRTVRGPEGQIYPVKK